METSPMTQEQILWSKEHRFWQGSRPRIAERSLVREGSLAVLSYRVTGALRSVRCTSTYARTCGSWMLLEHHQSAA
jgi:hypothetical protein